MDVGRRSSCLSLTSRRALGVWVSSEICLLMNPPSRESRTRDWLCAHWTKRGRKKPPDNLLLRRLAAVFICPVQRSYQPPFDRSSVFSLRWWRTDQIGLPIFFDDRGIKRLSSDKEEPRLFRVQLLDRFRFFADSCPIRNGRRIKMRTPLSCLFLVTALTFGKVCSTN